MATPVLILYGYQPREIERRKRLVALGQAMIELAEKRAAHLLVGNKGKALLLAVRIAEAREELNGTGEYTA